jgi:hypothetical protein
MRKHTLLGSAAILLIVSYGATAQTTGQKAEGSTGTPGTQTTTSPGSAASGEVPQTSTQNTQAPLKRNQAAEPSKTQATPRQNGATAAPSTAGAASPSNPNAGATPPTQSSGATAQTSGGKGAANAPPNGNTQSSGATTAQPTQAPAGSAQQTPQTTPNAQQATQPNAGTQQNPQQQATQPNNAGSQQTAPQQATSPNSGTQQNAQGRASGGVVSLNVQQRTQIGQTLARHNVKPITNVNFSIAVGTAVPKSVQLRAIPADLVTFIPQYRGYSYFVVEEQIVIVEPASYQIIAIVPYAGAGGHRAAAPTQSRAVKLSTQEREVVRKHTSRRSEEGPARKASKRYRVGDEVETTVTVEEFPETVYREAPSVRRYRYFRQDNDVILVDPDDHRVIDVLE